MNLIKETSRRLVQFADYNGVCDGCGGVLEHPGYLIGIEIFEDAEANYVVPIDSLLCPYCHKQIEMIRKWKSLEVTAELQRR